MIGAPARPGRPNLVRTLQRGFALQLGRRAPLLLLCDAVLVGTGMVSALLRGGEPNLVYVAIVQLPILLLGAAALADIVDLERRAGSLDLALALPTTERYFGARLAAVCLPLLLQSGLLVVFLWIWEEMAFPLLPALAAAILLVLVVGAAALFWATRIQSAGAVWLATVGFVGLLGRWTLANPIPERGTAAGAFFGRAEDVSDLLVNIITLLPISILLILATRRRLTHPASLVS
jgi:hypothetical protein